MLIRKTVLLPTVALAGLVAVTGIVLAQSLSERADCPGKINCPLTGEKICRDKCPTVDANRADCPGRIVCPLTGELVCKDRCPLAKQAMSADDKPAADKPAGQASKVPPCCAKKSGSA